MRVGSGGHAKVLISISHGKKDIVSMNRGGWGRGDIPGYTGDITLDIFIFNLFTDIYSALTIRF